MSGRCDGIDRRQFLAGSAALLVLKGLAVPRSLLGEANKPATAGTPILSVAVGEDPSSVTRRAVEALGGMGSFVRSGMKVLVKPNIGWDRSVAQGANTHPEVVRAVVQMCLDSGAERVTVLDRTCNDARRCYRTSGIQDMMEKLGDGRARLEHVLENRFTRTPFPQGRILKEWPIYNAALEADAFINVPVAKHHSISGLTLGMKNLMGVMGGNRGSIHSSIGQKLADVLSAVRPTLTVLDATRILFRNGPTGGRLEDVRILNTVAASADPVALDAFGATLFGLKPEQLSFVTAAASMGLGEMDLARVALKES